ncbi:helix-turn-helix transcriptional regulator [Brevundimonas sp. NPDC092305]|uniref:helix-turn-helix transcriptional regulator n=1 Tax=Brevundimonas sp. NPDC092305 TaxID=3363957 RepID=UPI0037F44ED0
MRSAIDAVQDAGFGERSWLDALTAVADLTGSMGAQLVGFGEDAAVPFNWVMGLPPEAAEEFVLSGGADPRVNSRVRVGMSAPELAVLDETAFSSAEDARLHRDYGRWLERYDLAFGCLSPLLRRDGLLVGMALMRNAAQGNVTADQKRAFAAVAPHARAAVRTQLAVGAQGWRLAFSLIDALSVVVIVCDRHGRILDRSALADDFLSKDTRLLARRGSVSAARDKDSAQLNKAISVAASPERLGPPPQRPVILRTRNGVDPLIVEVHPAPAAYALRHRGAALLIVRSAPIAEARRASIARDLFGLTAAEAVVAARLAEGLGPQAIAEGLEVGIGTIRTHIRRIYEKCEVNSQIELVALLTRL